MAFELSSMGHGKEAVTTTTSIVEGEQGLTRRQRDVEARESEKTADETVLARFGKKQQLQVSSMSYSAADHCGRKLVSNCEC